MKKHWLKKSRFLLASLGAVSVGTLILSACSSTSAAKEENPLTEAQQKTKADIISKFKDLKSAVDTKYTGTDSSSTDKNLKDALNNLQPLVEKLDYRLLSGQGSKFSATITWLKSLSNTHFSDDIKTKFEALMNELAKL